MSTVEMVAKIESLKEWEGILAEAQEVVEALKDDIKREMDTRGVEELEAGQYICRFTSIISNRLDNKALKLEHPEIYRFYLKQSKSRRFSIS